MPSKKHYTIPDESIHPELRRLGKVLRAVLPPFTPAGMKALALFSRYAPKPEPKDMKRSYRYAARPDGSKLRLAVYTPLHRREHPKPAPAVLWIHGGGYAFGSPEQDEEWIRGFIHNGAALVVSPDYTLSVEKPYPAAFEDCCLALEWMRDNLEAYGADSQKLMVGGDSAGGGLTVALCLWARDTGKVRIAFQMPIYPEMNKQLTPSSMDNDAPLINTDAYPASWGMYLGELYLSGEAPAYAVPAWAESFADLPPCFTYCGSIEPFRDETLTYAENLRKNGIPAECIVYDGCFHAFDILAGKTAIAREARANLWAAFRKASEA
ncbi:MAG: alpha/beta hydrolase [Oscillospiraceae bacterium]|jgi:acetyl esterase/lipase|nr:alpha/beta hydrolase [Oscillospiraceae bacterium]